MHGVITDPSAPGGLRFADDLPEPEPAVGEVVIEVRAFAVNRGELKLLELRPEHWRPGQDLAGVVVRAADDGSGPPEGTRVVAIAEGGGWAERIALPANVVVPLTDEVAFDQAAALPIAGLTALRALRIDGSVLGRKVLVTGATGGVGQFAIQLAVAGGAEVTAQVSHPDRTDLATSLGADHVLTALRHNSVGPFDLVLDALGGEVLEDAVHHLTPGGTVATYGNLAGEASLSFLDFRAAPMACIVGFFHAHPQDSRGDDLATLVRLTADGRLTPQLGSVRDWHQTRETLDALRAREVRGKAVLTIDER